MSKLPTVFKRHKLIQIEIMQNMIASRKICVH